MTTATNPKRRKKPDCECLYHNGMTIVDGAGKPALHGKWSWKVGRPHRGPGVPKVANLVDLPGCVPIIQFDFPDSATAPADRARLKEKLCKAVDRILFDFERGLQSEGKP